MLLLTEELQQVIINTIANASHKSMTFVEVNNLLQQIGVLPKQKKVPDKGK